MDWPGGELARKPDWSGPAEPFGEPHLLAPGIRGSLCGMERRREMERWLALGEREGLTFRELAERSGIPVGTLAWWAWAAAPGRTAPSGRRHTLAMVSCSTRPE